MQQNIYLKVSTYYPIKKYRRLSPNYRGELQLQGVCSSYKRAGQPPYKCALRSMQMYLLTSTNKKYEEKMHIEARKTIFLLLFKEE